LYVSAYVQRLSDLAKRSQAERAKVKAAQAEAEAAERVTPLAIRLARLLDELGEQAQREGLLLSELQLRLRGRRRGNAHAGELGRCLRGMGFERTRRWGKDATLSAIWRRVS
jgi:hypothetical protein